MLEQLYYIFNLHQTTTVFRSSMYLLSCIISLIYIKPQQYEPYTETELSCIISLIYIKPQLLSFPVTVKHVVLYL